MSTHITKSNTTINFLEPPIDQKTHTSKKLVKLPTTRNFSMHDEGYKSIFIFLGDK